MNLPARISVKNWTRTYPLDTESVSVGIPYAQVKVESRLRSGHAFRSEALDEASIDRNRLLATLTTVDRDRLKGRLRCIPLRSGQVLYEPTTLRRYVYFPLDCTLSLLTVSHDGHSVELATLGSEGFVGAPGIPGIWGLHTRVVAETAGSVIQAELRPILDAIENNILWQERLLQFVEALLVQSAQRLLCIRRHPLKLRLCRWLLLRLDWLGSSELHISHGFIAELLGVRRESITLALDELRAAGLIQVKRGHIRALNRQALESQVCECYRIIRQEYTRLAILPGLTDMQMTARNSSDRGEHGAPDASQANVR